MVAKVVWQVMLAFWSTHRTPGPQGLAAGGRAVFVSNPPAARKSGPLLTNTCCCFAGIPELVKKLQSQGKAVFLVSGGFRQVIHPIAESLGIPIGNVYANQLLFKVCFQRFGTLSTSSISLGSFQHRKNHHRHASAVVPVLQYCMRTSNTSTRFGIVGQLSRVPGMHWCRMMAAMLVLTPRSSPHAAMAKQQLSGRLR